MYETMILRLVCYGWEQISQGLNIGFMSFKKGNWSALVFYDGDVIFYHA